jgi:hypothetical protein
MENGVMNEENEDYQITLNCKDCDHPTCRLGQMIHRENDGCVRQVDEDLFIEYYHQLKEVWPFALKQSRDIVNREYNKLMDILYKVYSSPIVKRYGKGFKVIVLGG